MAKTPLVLVPGLLCDDALWKPQIDWLSDIAEPTVGDTLQDDSLSNMAARILDAAPDRFALAGLSMGDMFVWISCVKRRSGSNGWL